MGIGQGRTGIFGSFKFAFVTWKSRFPGYMLVSGTGRVNNAVAYLEQIVEACHFVVSLVVEAGGYFVVLFGHKANSKKIGSSSTTEYCLRRVERL